MKDTILGWDDGFACISCGGPAAIYAVRGVDITCGDSGCNNLYDDVCTRDDITHIEARERQLLTDLGGSMEITALT